MIERSENLPGLVRTQPWRDLDGFELQAGRNEAELGDEAERLPIDVTGDGQAPAAVDEVDRRVDGEEGRPEEAARAEAGDIIGRVDDDLIVDEFHLGGDVGEIPVDLRLERLEVRPGLEQAEDVDLLRGRHFDAGTVSYTHLRAHETDSYLVCRLL